MAFLFACFSNFKHKKCRRYVKAASTTEQKHEADKALHCTKSKNRANSQKSSNPITVSKEKIGEPVNFSTEKRGTFGSNLKTHEELLAKIVTNDLIRRNDDKEIDRDSENLKENKLEPNANYGCQNCAKTENGCESSGFEQTVEIVDGDGEKGKNFVIEESSESLFSLSIESRKQVFDVESGCEKEVTSPIIKPRPIQDSDENPQDHQIQCGNSVLNPIENLSERKAIKKGSLLKEQEKENIGAEEKNPREEPISKLSTKNLKMGTDRKNLPDQEIGLDTSLSSWLVDSESTPSEGSSASKCITSPTISHEDRCVLGELNLQEHPKQDFGWMSRIIGEVNDFGTIGCYWSRTGKPLRESERIEA